MLAAVSHMPCKPYAALSQSAPVIARLVARATRPASASSFSAAFLASSFSFAFSWRRLARATLPRGDCRVGPPIGVPPVSYAALSQSAPAIARLVARATRPASASSFSAAFLASSFAFACSWRRLARAALPRGDCRVGPPIGAPPVSSSSESSEYAPWAQEPPQKQQEAQVRVPATLPGALRPIGALEPLSTGPTEGERPAAAVL
jgi:hypothetical protein